MFLEYGLDPNGEYIHISAVLRGKGDLVCPYCAGQLIAKKGRVKIAHFAHAGATCKPADRKGDVIALPAFDRFDLELPGKVYDALRRFHDHSHYTGKEFVRLKEHELVQYNEWTRSDELTKLGRIPFGELPLQPFTEIQDKLIEAKHRDLMWEAMNATTEADQAIAATDLQLFRAQWRRVLSASLYFLEIDHPTGTLYKIGVTYRTIEDRIAEIQRDLVPHVGAVEIKLLRMFAHRGAAELYFKYRYHAQQYQIGQLTEYFELDVKTRKNVLSDLTRMGHKEPGLIEQAILINSEPVDPIIEQRLAEQRKREADRAAWNEQQAEWKRTQAEWRAARAPIERDSQVPITTPADTKTLTVNDTQRRKQPYTRTIKTRPVTFTCAECGQTVTEDLFPGGAPKWCNGCIREVRKRQNAERVRKHRAQNKNL